MNDVSRSAVMSRVEAEGFDYQTEADKTCSIVWNPQYVDYEDFRRVLRHFIEMSSLLNLYKKLLFRGVEPSAIHMKKPEESASLAGNGGHIPFDAIDLVHGIVGTCTESGELAEILLDLLEGKSPDRVNAIEECGDIRWYLNRILRFADCSDLQCEMTNIDKLHGRHGSSFDVFRDANRDLARERARLEDATNASIEAPTLPLGPHGDEEPKERVQMNFVRKPIGDCEGMDC